MHLTKLSVWWQNTYKYPESGLYMSAKTFRECPELSVELDLTKNRDLTYRGSPVDVLDLAVGSQKKLDWKCDTCEHEWISTGDNRLKGNGCPACSGRVVHSDGRNSMSNTHPQLAIEYQGDANLIIAGTHKKLDWKCVTCEHEWNSQCKSRSQGKGCPACAGRLHSDGRNSMSNTHPLLAQEYQGDANLIIAGTNKKLEWKCITCEHSWITQGYSRVMGRGCATCNRGDLHSDGRNSIANTHPQLAIEYQGDANLVASGTHKKLDWKCLSISETPCGHEWKSTGANRVNGTGCSPCNRGDLHSESHNSMFNTHPQLAIEYQGDANLIIAGTHLKLDWKCGTCEYEWRATGDCRTGSRETGCPACAKSGYDPSKIGYVYILTYNDGKNYWLKCGITGKPQDRFNQLTRAASRVNIEVQQLDIYTFDDGWVAQTCERELLDKLELRFNSEYDIDGKAEFFKYDALDEIKSVITKYL